MEAPLPFEVQSAGLVLIGLSQFLRLLPAGVLISLFLHCCSEHCVVIVHLEDGVLFCDGISVDILERLMVLEHCVDYILGGVPVAMCRGLCHS
jgi:hypothetical protein